MNTQHTPGEWKILPHFSKFDIYASTSKGRTIIATTNTKHISHVGTLEAESNAKLIGAAPELLEALKHVSRYFEDFDCNDRLVLDRIKNAIGKATK